MSVASTAGKASLLYRLGILTPILLVLVLVFGLLGVSTVVLGTMQSSATPTGNGSPSAYAMEVIPADMLAIYQSEPVKRQCPGLSWTIVAAIGHLESNDNRNPGISSAGARGASQFMPTTWESSGQLVVQVGVFGEVKAGYGVDGDGDGLADIMNPLDSVPASARLLCANGGGNPNTLRNAVYAYNHAWWYVDGGRADNGSQFEGIIPLAARLQDLTTSQGIPGKVIIAPGANAPGRPIKTETMDFFAIVAGIYGRPITVGSGTNRSTIYTASGGLSDHPPGFAGDFGMRGNGGFDRGPVGDGIAAACLIASGYPADQAQAMASLGGLWSTTYNGYRTQCIWKTQRGGNHDDHVHISARRVS